MALKQQNQNVEPTIANRRWTNVPNELVRYDHWVAWKLVKLEEGKDKKVPIDVKTGREASVSDPTTWASFGKAIKFLENNRASGIGFVMAEDDPFTGVDLDDCFDFEENTLDEKAWDYINAQKSYTEFSPSGSGIHVWVRGKIPRNLKRKGFEIYDNRRFLTVTGRPVPGFSRSDPADGGSTLQELWQFVDGLGREPYRAEVSQPVQRSDEDLEPIVEAARRGPNRAKFKRLWAGNMEGYPSRSEADLALCRILALHTGGRSQLVDRLFRKSSLFRPKWDRVHDQRGRTYGQMTIAKAQRRAMQELKSDWGVRSADESFETGSGAPQDFLVRELLPRKSLGILVGNSNIGKSPLLYQLGLCVAAGLPFLGFEVQKERVLYIDLENGTAQTQEIIENVSSCLNLTQRPRNFSWWNWNSAPVEWGQKGKDWAELIRNFRPGLAIIDSLSSLEPDVENRNSNATKLVQKIRKIIRDVGTSVLVTHHLTKPTLKREKPESLDRCKQLQKWFFQARGPGALINATDVRIGAEQPVQN